MAVPAAAPAQASPAKAQALFDLANIDWATVLTHWALALVILLVGMWLARWVSSAIERALARAGVDGTLSGFLRNVSYAVLVVVVAIAALQKAGVPTTSVLAVLGAAGLAIGLALKDSLSNIASGVMLIVLRPFRDGDHVQVAGLEGVIEEIRIFQTRMKTFDNRLIILPNSMITTAPIINFTAKPKRRVEILVAVGYQDDPAQARQVLLDIAAGNPLVLKTPEPSVQVTRMSETGLDLTLFAWTKTKDFGEARSQLTEAVRARILAAGLSIPVPQRNLRVYHHDADGRPLHELLTRSVVDDGDVAPPKPPAR